MILLLSFIFLFKTLQFFNITRKKHVTIVQVRVVRKYKGTLMVPDKVVLKSKSPTRTPILTCYFYKINTFLNYMHIFTHIYICILISPLTIYTLKFIIQSTHTLHDTITYYECTCVSISLYIYTIFTIWHTTYIYILIDLLS